MVYETVKVSYCRLSQKRTAAGRSGPNSSLKEKIARLRAERDILKKAAYRNVPGRALRRIRAIYYPLADQANTFHQYFMEWILRRGVDRTYSRLAGRNNPARDNPFRCAKRHRRITIGRAETCIGLFRSDPMQENTAISFQSVKLISVLWVHLFLVVVLARTAAATLFWLTSAVWWGSALARLYSDNQDAMSATIRMRLRGWILG